MGKEIERKWLLNLTEPIKNYIITQGGDLIKDYYFNKYTRLRNKNGNWFITIKGEGTLVRDEFEFAVDKSQINFLPVPILQKKRVYYDYKGHVFEINVFKDIDIIYMKEQKRMELMLVECELSSPDEEIELPDFIGEEVTAYQNFYSYTLFKELLKQKRFCVLF